MNDEQKICIEFKDLWNGNLLFYQL